MESNKKEAHQIDVFLSSILFNKLIFSVDH